MFGQVSNIIKEIHRQEKGLLAFGLIGAVLSGLSTYISLFLAENLIKGAENRDERWLVGVVTIGIGWCFISLLYLYCKRQYESRLFSCFLGFANQVATTGMNIPYSYTMNSETLALAQRAQNAVSGSGVGLHKMITSMIDGVGSFIGCIATGAILGRVNLWVPIYCFVLIVLGNCLLMRVKKIQISYQQLTDENQRRNMHLHLLMSDFAYGKDIRLFNAVSWLLEKFAQVQKFGEELLKEVCKKTWAYRAIELVFIFLRECGTVLYFIVKLIHGDVLISEFVVLLMGLKSFSEYGNKLMGNIVDFYAQRIYINSYFEYKKLGEYEEKETRKCPEVLHTIAFKDVSFRYGEETKWVLRHFSLQIKAGEKVALVGVNGAGKTTTISLLCRFFEPTEGEICINDIPISEIPIKEYYKLLAAAFQDATLFSFSLWENITMSQVTERTEERDLKVRELIKIVGLQNKIGDHVNYIKQNVSKRFDEKGVVFSGGEQCKIILARALYKDSPCILLDEPTAALDPIAEQEVYKLMKEMYADKTMIFISHRMASARFCDRILFLQDGRILEDGNFQQLMAKKGEYEKLFNTQAKYYAEDNI